MTKATKKTFIRMEPATREKLLDLKLKLGTANYTETADHLIKFYKKKGGSA